MLAVDLDGTLCRTDTVLESFFALLCKQPLLAMRIAFSLRHGVSGAKARLAEASPIDAGQLPINASVLGLIRQASIADCRVCLITGAPQEFGDAVAAHVGEIDDVIGTRSGERNMVGAEKVRALNGRYGEGKWSYVGNSTADVPVWERAVHVYAVTGPSKSIAYAKRADAIAIPTGQARCRTVLKALRVHQWLKNLLLFVPLMLAHAYAEPATLVAAVVAFVAFSLAASSAYLINDLADLKADRAHPQKRFRPFAAGDLPLAWGIVGAPMLLVCSLGLALIALPPLFMPILLLYVAATVAYTFKLKRVPVVDTFTLAALYGLRVLAGGAATGLALSLWLLIFSLFLFYSLACVKRVAEIISTGSARGYSGTDGAFLRETGIGSGYLAVLVLALYVNAPESAVLYRGPQLLWAIVPFVFFWVTRVWHRTIAGRMHHDPILFAVRDRVSQIGVLICLMVTILAR